MGVLETLSDVLVNNGLITAFAFVGIVVWLSYLVSNRLTAGRIHGSAIAILVGLVLAWAGGTVTGGSNGLADVTVLGVAVQLRGASAGRAGDTSRARGEPGTTMMAVRIRGPMR